MLAMPGLRVFWLAAKQGSEGISCDVDGVFVGGIPILQPPGAGNALWRVRPLVELNKELTGRYRLPINIAAKASGFALIAAAFNRGDVAMAAIAAVQMQIPDPPPLAQRAESRGEIARCARELIRSGLLKFFWDPAQHPRAGVPPNPGWFELVTDKPGPLEPVPIVVIGNPADKPWEPPPEAEGEGAENAPRGILELPRLGGSPSASGPSTAPKPPVPIDAQPSLPFPDGLPPQLAPYVPGEKTSGILYTPGGSPIPLQSGYAGPAAAMQGTAGYDRYTLSHAEGHAAALMRQEGITEGTLYINNRKICSSCQRLLPTMLAPGTTLNVVLPDNTIVQFTGIGP